MLSKIFNSKKRRIFEESYILIGPAGVGKTLVSEKLSKRTGLPVVSTDILGYCPKNIAEIEVRKKDILAEIKEIQEKLSRRRSDHQKALFTERLNWLENEARDCDREVKMRQMFPNLPNYFQLGFKGKASDDSLRKYGYLGWHYYHKQFETKLLAQLVKQLDRPCIIELGAGVPITFENQYLELSKKMAIEDFNFLTDNFNFHCSTFDKIKKAIKPFDNIVYLKPVSNGQSMCQRFHDTPLNKDFLATRQYEKLATITQDTDGLITQNGYNKKRMETVLDSIEDQKFQTFNQVVNQK